MQCIWDVNFLIPVIEDIVLGFDRWISETQKVIFWKGSGRSNYYEFPTSMTIMIMVKQRKEPGTRKGGANGGVPEKIPTEMRWNELYNLIDKI
jgi:hypothetical protein